MYERPRDHDHVASSFQKTHMIVSPRTRFSHALPVAGEMSFVAAVGNAWEFVCANASPLSLNPSPSVLFRCESIAALESHFTLQQGMTE
jgi:hypothetical protein